MSKRKVLVGLSGGVDSAVSAYLLKEEGYDVSAGFMINYLTEDDSCPTRLDMAIAQEVAEYLKIPFFTFDFIEEYEKKVLQYIFNGYKKGLTPNPDVFCNTWIKFDLFRQEALAYGYDIVATGHYARIEQKEEIKEKKDGLLKNSDNAPLIKGGGGDFIKIDNELQLLRGVDPDKDQSYFLSALTREQLNQTLFPIGHLLKSEVRDIARRAGLPNAERKDSQGLCFVGKVDFSSFLKSHILVQKGPIKDKHGTILGEHDGAFQYTIGQRKGIRVGGGPALYVLEKDVQHNVIIVGAEDDPHLYRTSCTLTQINWLADISLPLTCEAQIRYRQAPQKCSIKVQSTKNVPVIPELGGLSRTISGIQENQTREAGKYLEVTFDTPQRAITPGQVCALYDGERVIGSGIIALEEPLQQPGSIRSSGNTVAK